MKEMKTKFLTASQSINRSGGQGRNIKEQAFDYIDLYAHMSGLFAWRDALLSALFYCSALLSALFCYGALKWLSHR